MGTRELVGKIVSDAKARAAQILEDGQRAASEIEIRAQAESTRILDEASARGRQASELILEQTRSRGRMGVKQAELAAKWRVIDRVFERAAELILSDTRYTEGLELLRKKYERPGVSVEPCGEGTEGGLVVHYGSETIDLSVKQTLHQVREMHLAEIARKLFAGSG